MKTSRSTWIKLSLLWLIVCAGGWWRLQNLGPSRPSTSRVEAIAAGADVAAPILAHPNRSADPYRGPGWQPVSSAPEVSGPLEPNPVLRPWTYGTEWDHAAEPALARFREWTQRYLEEADPTGRTALVREGISLAQDRRQSMVELIKADPRLALAVTVPLAIRSQLPSEIDALLEERIAGQGDLSVVGVTPLAGQKVPEPIIKSVVFKDRAWRASVYGRRQHQTTKYNVSLHGIALDGLLAVHESPVRALEPGEVLDPAKPLLETCPISGNAMAVVAGPGQGVGAAEAIVEVGGAYDALCTAEHAPALEDRLIAAEGRPGPEVRYPAMGGADSGDPSRDEAAASPLDWTQGPKTVLFMRVNFPDDLEEPISQSDAVALMNSVNDFFVENSYDSTSLTATVTPLLTLPQTKDWYTNAGWDRLLQDARSVAASAGFDTASYDLDCVQHKFIFSGWSGRGYVGAKGAWLQFSSAGVAAHEFGHNYGLWHANFWRTSNGSVIGPGANEEYGNVFDTMGVARAGPYQFNVYHKNILNWLPGGFVQTVTTSGVYRLYPFDVSGLSSGLKYALKIKKDDQRDYWVEIRQAILGNSWLQNGVVLNWSPWRESNGGTQLLDTTPGSPYDRDDAALTIGRTFNDPEAGLRIRPVAKGGSVPNEYMDVEVELHAQPYMVAIEAESAPLFGPMAAYSDALAYGGSYIATPIANQGRAAFEVNVPFFGQYVIWCRVLARHPGQDSFFVNVDQSSLDTNVTNIYDVAQGTWTNVWQWTRVNQRDLNNISLATDPRLFNLSAGTHTIVFGGREAGTQLDRLVITDDLSFVPEPPATISFRNTTDMGVPGSEGRATLYPSIIGVSAVPGDVSSVRVRLNWLNHTRPDDLDILLVGPIGQAVLLMSDAGGQTPMLATLTFDDTAEATLPDEGPIVSGTFRPADFEPGSDFFPTSAPSGPYATSLSAFAGTNPNGVWSLYIFDDDWVAGAGTMDGGWSLSITTLSNSHPSIELVSPTNGASFPAGTQVTLEASATDPDGSIAQVRFFDNAINLGQASTSPYVLTWTATNRGVHALTAVATDNLGGQSTSSVVRVTVVGGGPIQTLVDAAQPGATIEIPAGTHLDTVIIDKNLTLRGTDPASTIIDGDARGTVFTINSGITVLLQNLQIRTGSATSQGGGIVNYGTLTLENCVLFNNRATYGGGIYNLSSLTVSNSRLINNSAGNSGGAIFNVGRVVIDRSMIRSNSAGRGGGLVNFDDSVITMYHCTLSDNLARSAGGGIDNSLSSRITLLNCTISGNSAGSAESGESGTGGAVWSGSGCFLAMTNCTVSANQAGDGGGIWNRGTGQVKSSILAGNVARNGLAGDYSGELRSAGYILLQNTQGCTLTGDLTGNIVGQDPLLGPLQDNGGPTLTHALWPGSPAIDQGSCGDATTDQRGVPRPQDVPTVANAQDGCDIGAYELVSNSPPSVELVSPTNGASFPAGTQVTLEASATDPDGSIAQVRFFDNAINLGQASTSPYVLTWTATNRGVHALTAVATDNLGGQSTSSVVRVTVVGGGPIQTLVDAAQPGATIEIPAGTHLDTVIIDKDLTLRGVTAASTIVDGDARGSVFIINSNITVFLLNLQIRTGSATDRGGGILNYGTLTLENCVLCNNRAPYYGGGIYNLGSLTVRHSLMNHNATAVWGGAIFNLGALVIDRSIIRSNSAGFGGGLGNSNDGVITVFNSTLSDNLAHGYRFLPPSGGGINNNNGAVTLQNCTISSNSAGYGYGGGIRSSGSLTLQNCTISGNSVSGNSAGSNGGGVFNEDAAHLTLTHCTVSANQGGDGGGIWNRGTAQVKNSILAGNVASGGLAADYFGPLQSEGYNLIQNTNGCSLTGDLTGNMLGQDPLLGPLQDNGGLTLTHALWPGSPAIDQGSCAGVTTDQRGTPRPQDASPITNASAGCDIGAFEFALLRLHGPERLADGCLRLFIRRVDGLPVEASRLPWIEVHATTNVVHRLTDWTRLTNGLVLRDGGLELDDAESGSLPRRFYQVIERP